MLTCDICKKEVERTPNKYARMSLPYEFAKKAWQYKNFDVCISCQRRIDFAIEQAKCDLVNGNSTEEDEDA